jgi:hypothetical protein
VCNSSGTDKTATVTRKIFQIILWIVAGAYIVIGILAITGVLGSAREADSLGHAYAVFGSMILIIGATAAVVTFLANKWRGWLIVAPIRMRSVPRRRPSRICRRSDEMARRCSTSP